jgi:hypothetical protein
MAELPADVHAALDAYLAARVDDATWERYVNSLLPGVALDVATDLCLWTESDEGAVEAIRRNFESNPDAWADLAVPEPLPGVQALRTLQDFIDAEPSCGSYSMTLAREVPPRSGPARATYTVRLDYVEWESAGVYRAEESQAEHDAVLAHYRQYGIWLPRVDPWLVAACRAACLAWKPEWARAQTRYTEAC